MTFAQRRNRLTSRFSERIPVVKRRISVYVIVGDPPSFGVQTTSNGSFVPTLRVNLSCTIFKGQALLEVSRCDPIGWHQTSARAYQYSLREIKQDRRHQLHPRVSLKPRACELNSLPESQCRSSEDHNMEGTTLRRCRRRRQSNRKDSGK